MSRFRWYFYRAMLCIRGTSHGPVSVCVCLCLCWVHIVYHALPPTKSPTSYIDLIRTSRISSFCTVAWQMARFQLTRRIARSLGDSWASCMFCKADVDQREFLFLSSFSRAILCIRGTSHGLVSVCMSVRLSVRPSVTSWSSTKTAKRRITQTTPHDTPGSLVLWCQISPRNATGVTPYQGAECRWGGSKSATFDK